jgi:hypothetical protein
MFQRPLSKNERMWIIYVHGSWKCHCHYLMFSLGLFMLLPLLRWPSQIHRCTVPSILAALPSLLQMQRLISAYLLSVHKSYVNKVVTDALASGRPRMLLRLMRSASPLALFFLETCASYCCCAPHLLLLLCPTHSPTRPTSCEREETQHVYPNTREYSARAPMTQLHARERGSQRVCPNARERASACPNARERRREHSGHVHVLSRLYAPLWGHAWWRRGAWCSACLSASPSTWGAVPVATYRNKVKQLKRTFCNIYV